MKRNKNWLKDTYLIFSCKGNLKIFTGNLSKKSYTPKKQRLLTKELILFSFFADVQTPSK
jgi:hypothetical protein